MISATFWVNPVTYFQNKLNSISETHYEDYQGYRNTIQTKIDHQIKTMVLDLWNDVKVDKLKYLEYNESLSFSD
jgi:ABC-2 type transport system permease protein